MKKLRSLFLCFTAAALAVSPVALQAIGDGEAAAGRALLKQYADVVVGVEMVITVKVTVGGRTAPPREQKVEVNGTVLDARGLVVTSLASVDPRVQFEMMRASLTGQAASMEVSETEYKEVKLRLADGKEIAARVVLKDADLDLAFIAPVADDKAAVRTFTCADLTKATEGEVLGSYFAISRAAKNQQRVALVRPVLIAGIVEKPRRQYLMTEALLGAPVYDAKGLLLGITLQQPGTGRTPAFVVLPAADVEEIAKQAQAARDVVPAPEAAKPAEEAGAPAAAPVAGAAVAEPAADAKH